uniref:MADF domain-containing protein n=2 Tax=Parascaris univalens TaxID=6257 RepID=A0A915CF88_PARUN
MARRLGLRRCGGRHFNDGKNGNRTHARMSKRVRASASVNVERNGSVFWLRPGPVVGNSSPSCCVGGPYMNSVDVMLHTGIQSQTHTVPAELRSPANLNPPGEPSFNEVLIKTVRDYPPLYVNCRRSYDSVDRHEIWKEVAARIGRKVSPEFAKKRWLQLRDRYRKELKIAIAQNFSQPQKWNHFALLKWLDPHLQGGVPVAAAEHSVDNSSPLSCLDGVLKNSASYTEYAANLAAQAQNDKIELPESALLDDVKPMLSTIQSVLAATEVKLADEKNAEDSMENIFAIESGNQSLAEAASDTATLPIQQVMPPSDASHVSVDSDTSLAGFLSSCQSTQPATVTNEREITKRVLEHQQDCNGSSSSSATTNGCKLPIAEFMPPTCSSSPSSYKSPSYANVLRIRARNLNKYRPSSSICSPSTQSTIMAVGASGCGTDDWFNNEEMLFARIVGLRLRKMDPCRRKEVRTRIMNILDEEIDQDLAEVATSVAE